MTTPILDYFAQQHASFLHGQGRLASRKMLAKLALQGQESILEIGCGTGASLVMMKNTYPELQICGCDISPLMCQKARQRMTFVGLDKAINIRQLSPGDSLPFPDESFDVIWIESVLAILDTQLLRQMLTEVRRVLKPGGRLASNESLWLPSVQQEEIDRINQECLTHFSIIQANGEFPCADNWESLFVDHGFKVQVKTEFTAVATPPSPPLSFTRLRSLVFSRVGRLKAMASSSQSSYSRQLQQLTKEISGLGEQKLEAYLFVLVKG